MKSTNSIRYATYVWLATVLLSPSLVILYVGYTDGFSKLSETAGGYFMMVLNGALFSTLSWILFMMAVHYITKTKWLFDNFCKKRCSLNPMWF